MCFAGELFGRRALKQQSRNGIGESLLAEVGIELPIPKHPKQHTVKSSSCSATALSAPKRPCEYRAHDEDPSCPVAGFYLLELVSHQGPRTQVVVCRDHVHRSWEFGQRVLDQRFRNRQLRLIAVRLMPILVNKRKRAKAASQSS